MTSPAAIAIWPNASAGLPVGLFVYRIVYTPDVMLYVAKSLLVATLLT